MQEKELLEAERSFLRWLLKVRPSLFDYAKTEERLRRLDAGDTPQGDTQ